MLRSFFLFFLFQALFICAAETKNFVVYYGESEDPANFAPYSLVVFESENHPVIEGLLESGKTVLGYLNLGEVEDNRFYFKEVKDEGILLEENPNWKGSFFVDLRDKRWTKRVLENLIPAILFQGFTGIFIDTLDNAAYLEEKDPSKYKGMKKAAIDLVKAIRLNYPDMKIMLNRGFEILPGVAKDIDMELAESIFSEYNQKKKTYELIAKPTYESHVKVLKEAQKINPNLEIYTLDYWDLKDPEGIKKIYHAEREQGFIPYVATWRLNKLVKEPK